VQDVTTAARRKVQWLLRGEGSALSARTRFFAAVAGSAVLLVLLLRFAVSVADQNAAEILTTKWVLEIIIRGYNKYAIISRKAGYARYPFYAFFRLFGSNCRKSHVFAIHVHLGAGLLAGVLKRHTWFSQCSFCLAAEDQSDILCMFQSNLGSYRWILRLVLNYVCCLLF
jgi:hypothetical protein